MHTTDPLLELTSRLRYELLNASGEYPALKQLFRYFNSAYHNLSGEREARLNPSAKIKNRAALGNNSSAINALFDQVFELLKNDTPIDKRASAELMLLYSLGLNVVYDWGRPREEHRQKFYQQIIEQYNDEFNATFVSLQDIDLI